MPTRNLSLETHSQFSEDFNQSVYFKDGLRLKDSSIEDNVIIAGRPRLYAKLMNVVAFDLDISSFELHEGNDLIAICAGRVVYVLRLSTWTVIERFGRVDGGAHKGNIRDISIDVTCQYIASAGDDKRIAVWNIKKKVTEITFEAHSGAIFQVEFSGHEGNLITCSEDGLVLIWDWRTGTAISSFMRHPSSVRAFDFNYDSPNQVYCARNDGHISVWNTDYLMRMDNIEPDLQWQANAIDESLLGYNNVRKGHSGSILCLKVAPNGWLLVSGSSDHTCKIWCTISYKKFLSQVQEDILRAEQSVKELNSCIDITNPLYDLQEPDRSVLKIGETHIPTAYQANLLWTLRHNGPVISLSFSPDSTIIATGSTDATCRLWSTVKGDLLFQIDAPSAINRIYFSDNSSFYCSCLNRLLYFDYNIKARENTQKEMVPTPELVYSNRKDQIMSPISQRGANRTTYPMSTFGVNNPISTGGANNSISTGGANNPISTSGANNPISTGGVNNSISTGGANNPIARRQRKKLPIITEGTEEEKVAERQRRQMSSFREEDEWEYEKLGSVALTEEEMMGLSEEQRRKYISARSSFQERESNHKSDRSGTHEINRGSIRGSNTTNARSGLRANNKRNSTNYAFNIETIEEFPEDYEENFNSRESMEMGRKRSLDNYAGQRASREKVLSEEYIRDISDEESYVLPPNTTRRVSLLELKNLAAGNLLNYSAFKSIAEHSEGVDVQQLEKNMEKYGIRPNQVLKVMTSNPFKPDHILQALSKASGGEVPVLFAMISRNNPIATYMNKMGYAADGTMADADQKRRTIVLEKKDVQSPLKRGTIISSKTNTFNYEKWYRASFGAPSFEVSNRRNVHDELSSDESEDDLNINAAFSIKDRNSSKHKILHFIPSAQMKILKDFSLNRNINPIFLRQLIAESETGSIYPNFNVDDSSDIQPSVIKINKVERFNENSEKSKPLSEYKSTSKYGNDFRDKGQTLVGHLRLGVSISSNLKTYSKRLDTNFDFSSFVSKLPSKSVERAGNAPKQRVQNTQNSLGREFRNFTQRPPAPNAMKVFKNMGSSSLNQLPSSILFQPDRYFKTRGLSVRFDGKPIGSNSQSEKGYAFAFPTVIRKVNNDNNLVDIYTKRQKKYRETNID